MANLKSRKVVGFEFKPFSKKQLKILTFWQEGSPVKDKFMIAADGAIRSGKDQPLYSKLFTPNGYTTMGNIAVGDYVFDETGKKTMVTDIFPQKGLKDVYEITFHDGSKAQSSKTHLWSYTTKKCIENGNKTVFTSELGDIIKDLERFSDRKHIHQRAGKYKFPINSYVNFDPQNVKIDPYLLGLLLGDGCFTEKNSGVSFTGQEIELHKYIAKIITNYDMKYRYYEKNGNHCAYGSLQVTQGSKSKLRILLEEYNLYGCYSHNKFIPDDYKFNSKDIRLHVLAGLLNTDGCAINNRPSMSFSSTSKQLVDDVTLVARSLGMFVNTDKVVDRREKNKHDCYECNMRVSEELYPLLSDKHKKRLRMDTTKLKEYRMIKEIKYIGKERTQCIMVDSPSHLYLTDDFVVTHNSLVSSLSFVLYVMNTFNGQNAGLAGKSVGSLRRNILGTLKQMIMSLGGYELTEHRSDNYFTLTKGDVFNDFWLFGGKDEGSQDLVQGITLCSCFLDECALYPLSFFNQITARLSVEKAKCFMTTNPNSPYHWFYTEVLLKLREKNGLYVHFVMDDNTTLSKETLERYKTMYSGVFYDRFILGKWVLAMGLIYDSFNKNTNLIEDCDIPYHLAEKYVVGVDYGTGNATAFLLCFKGIDGIIYICKEYYFAGRLEAEEKEDYEAQKTDKEYSDDMKVFLGSNVAYTQRSFTDIEIMVDPAASSFKLQLRRDRMKAKNANNEVLDGIRTVASLMKQGKLKIAKGCKNLIKELHTYSWDDKAQLVGIDRPLKKSDHACFYGGTPVSTTKGSILIKDLVGKDGLVKSYDIKNGECIKPFKNVALTKKNAKVIKLYFTNGEELILTPDHPILNTMGKWVRADESLYEEITCINSPRGMENVYKIEDAGYCDVYNMYVEDTHTFMVTKSGIITHNCDAMRYSVMKLKDKKDVSSAGRNIGI